MMEYVVPVVIGAVVIGALGWLVSMASMWADNVIDADFDPDLKRRNDQ